jgi:uncharacterized protein (TIGR03437 family)
MQKPKILAGSFLTALFLFPAFCQAQTISIVSGNGQLICPDCTGGPHVYAPLVVQVNDSSGQPMANTTVTWTATQQGVNPVTGTSVTNTSGQATYTFVPEAFFFDSNFLPATVVAAALNISVQFVETTTEPVLSGPGEGSVPVVVTLVPATSTPVLTGMAGQTATTAITVSVVGSFVPLSGVQVSLQPWVASGSSGAPGALPWPSTAPSVTCATQAGQEAGTVLTDSSGTATCTPVFGDALGSGSYTLVVGGSFVNFGSTGFTVDPGAPAVIKLVSGNNQSVNSGSEAISALEAEITDLGGNPSNDAAVTWTVTSGTATLINPSATSNSLGQVSAYVKPTAGPVQVKVALTSNSAVNFVFTVNVNTVVTALQTVSGNNQQAKEGAAFADPLIVQVNDNTTPVSGATVNFVVTSGPATLSAASATTNATGQAQVTVTAGSTSGPVVITASVTSTSSIPAQTFDLTVIPPGPVITSVVNAASFTSQFVSPCSLATIYGSGLAAGIQGVVSAFVAPQTLVQGIGVTFGGVAAPILSVADVNGQESVSVQVPCEVPSSSAVPPATVPMVVTADGAASAPFNVTVLPVSPGIFQFTDTDAQVRAVLVRQDGTFINLANPARPGDTLRMYVTGLGQTTPALFTNEFDPLVELNGSWLPQALPVNNVVVVGVENGGVLVLSAQYAYGMVGVYEVDFQVPQNAAANNSAPFAVVVYQGSNVVFGNGSLIPIQ